MKFSPRRISAMIFLVCQVLGAGQNVPGLEGKWRGTLDIGFFNMPLLLTISRTGDRYAGRLNGTPLADVRVQGDSFQFELNRKNAWTLNFGKDKIAAFNGRINAEHSEINGTMTGTSLPPVVFMRDGERAAKQGYDVRVPVPPAPFRGGGKTNLVYELQITNSEPNDADLEEIDVSARGSPIALFAGRELKRIVTMTRVPADGAVTAFIWISFPAGSTVPPKLSHRLKFASQTLEGPDVAVSTEPLLVLGPPVRGDNWRAMNGPSNDSQRHRRAALPGGISSRFAIDWFRLWPNGNERRGSSKDNKSYSSYGADALAVADAVVVETRDGIPENVPGTTLAVPMTRETIFGNLVTLDMDGSRFATYAHLQPGSLRVKVGDRVRRGQVLGLVGNSGNSDAPHLHFQVTDRNSILESEGVPYLIGSFEVLTKAKKYERRENELPIDNETFRFQLIESGKLRTVIGRRYPFAQIAQAHAYADTGHKVGSVLVLVDDANDP